MHRSSSPNTQFPLISALNELSEKQRKRLDESWAVVFFNEIFCRLKEEPFAVLYSDCPSRPNYPVRVLVALEFLKAGNGWTDEVMYDRFCFDTQVRYALGLWQLGDGEFDLRTLYYFRERLSRYMQEIGINLVSQAFEQVTDGQITAFRIKTGMQRMDSTQVASNIHTAGRLQLLVSILQRVHRMLTEEDKAQYSEVFAPYIQGHAGQYVYHLKGQDTSEHLQKIGELMQRLVTELQPGYAQDLEYQKLERVFGEHFRVEEKVLKTKVGKELSASSMQSPDDPEATYRQKGQREYVGYVANITETCDPDNPLQLITQVQVAPNNTEDADLLVEALPNLQARTELETLYTDGGYGSADADQALQDNQVELVQTAIRGRVPSTEKLNLSDFEIKQSQSGTPTQITCPGKQNVAVQQSNQKKGYVAHFEAETCQGCPFLSKCPAQRGKRDERWHLRFTQEQARMSQRRRKSRLQQKEGRNLRAAIESTICSLKRRFPASKLPVRGRFRVTCMMIGSALMSNIRRIKRYLEALLKPNHEPIDPEKQRKSSREQSPVSFLSALRAMFGAWMTLLTLRTVRFGY
jgi:hypothetical protein